MWDAAVLPSTVHVLTVCSPSEGADTCIPCDLGQGVSSNACVNCEENQYAGPDNVYTCGSCAVGRYLAYVDDAGLMFACAKCQSVSFGCPQCTECYNMHQLRRGRVISQRECHVLLPLSCWTLL